MKVIIVGGVAGGASCAARLRRLDEKADILMVERGPYVSYANCGLPYYIGRDIEKRSNLLLQTPEGFAARYRITARVGTEALEKGVANFLAQSVKSNVRELEGTLLRLAQFHKLFARDIRVVGAHIAAGEQHVRHAAAAPGPAGDRARAGEIGVVRMREDHHRAVRDRVIEFHRALQLQKKW